ncbi:hypothetical protein S4A8_05798 [Salinisphaera sp. S4-8]|uniref:hypothetical protein n=1 Tax=Salinisphaera sp. S4-8 TaxID=633357 RepID=UPI00333E4E04
MNTTNSRRAVAIALAATAALASSQAGAHTLYDNGDTVIDFDFEAAVGVFNSSKSYAQVLRTEDDSPTWQEGYAKYGLSAATGLDGAGSVYGAFNLLSSATRGDGDAGGFSTGKEEDTQVEDAYIGWVSGDLVPWLGEDGIDLSFGRQSFTIGDGFLINGDSLNFGEGFQPLADAGIAPNGLSRGGAYWLAARKAFDKTAILRLGGDSGFHLDGFWLHSDNKAQAEMELAGANLEYRDATYGTVGVTYLKGLDVDEESAEFLGYQHRDGQKTLAFRANGSLGVENLFVSTEYVDQDNGDDYAGGGDDHAWYGEAGWTFADMPWSPKLTYRFSSFSGGFDPLFFGFNRGYGTWFQGEVAANYAGPFNSDTDVHHVGLALAPSETVELGALFFQFDNAGDGFLDGNEVDLYAQWIVNEHLVISPLVGFYTPDKSAAEGGTQIGDDDTNVYSQVIAIVNF